ncbi:hypothetical protein EZV62_024392 [Acer yangbiense]|uniref:Uncharacterized protein n=1 Tax=Acer yangbiense TaxID=1000413 RepID=A0A5C7GVM3_9ROSI|nr:hypothetical protein EZV62_024392 [Acer yangbiense]
MPIEMSKGLLFSVDTFTPTSRSTVAEIESSGFLFKPKAVNFHDKSCQINNGEIAFQGNSMELSSEEFHDDFDAESILDEEIEQESNAQNSSLINKVRTSCLTPHNILFRHKIGSRMRDIRERLDEIAKERSDFHLIEGGVERRSSLDPEDIGNEIWKELCWRSFFENLGEDDFGYNKGFKMHDLVHDLAQFITEDECLSKKIEISKRTFHYSWMNNGWESYHSLKALYGVETLRTFLVHSRYSYHDSASCLDFSRLCSLRVFSARFQSSFDFSRLSSLRVFSARVENPRDAKEANLVGKRNLLQLSLSWRNDSDLQSQEDVEKVLEALKPYANLKQLNISGYKGSQFPSWMSDNILNNVVYINLTNCDKCSKLPPLTLLPCLRTLDLYNMSQVMYIDDHFQGGGMARGFPSLKNLLIVNLPSLQRFSREDGRELLPCLKSLDIDRCPKLTLPHLPSVENLIVGNCNGVICGSISNLKNLISLEVNENDELNYLPEGMLLNLTSLKTLKVGSFRPTEIVSLTSLKRLDIRLCNELESFPEQGMEGLKCLKYLSLRYCRKFASLTDGLQHLSYLETLSLCGCPELVALPDGMKYLTSLLKLELSGYFVFERGSMSLQSLSISDYSNLASLPHWLGDLTSLQTLIIRHCPKLSSLPARIQGLTMLQILVICGCPELEKRCEKEKGEDWYKIAHIPNVEEFRGVFLGKEKKDEKINNTQLPKLAPQFDGMNSSETLVAHSFSSF